jgi:hypothetical protein
MSRRACQLRLLAALLAAAPVAFAGTDIVKCVDHGGHVTLTDQPCADGAVTVRLTSAPAEDDAAAPMVEHYPAPPVAPHLRAAHPLHARHPGLALDVATIKAAYAQLLLNDSMGKAQAQPRLAGLAY